MTAPGPGGDKSPPGAVVTVAVEQGPVEVTVRRDLAQLGRLDTGVRATLAEMALKMARAYDRYEGADVDGLDD